MLKSKSFDDPVLFFARCRYQSTATSMLVTDIGDEFFGDKLKVSVLAILVNNISWQCQ